MVEINHVYLQVFICIYMDIDYLSVYRCIFICIIIYLYLSIIIYHYIYSTKKIYIDTFMYVYRWKGM